ncbi:MAG: mucoidy inhibitor MuiA family protein [Shimia sp.]
MRFLLPLTLAPLAALADDLPTAAVLDAATVYPQGAVLTHSFAQSVPQGRHRVLVPLTEGEVVDRSLTGDVTILGASVVQGTVDAEAAFSPAQLTAREARDRAEEALRDALSDQAALRADIAAQEAQIAFYRALGPGHGADATPEVLGATAEEIVAGVETAQATIAALQAALAEGGDAVAAAERAVSRAETALARSGPPDDDTRFLALDVFAAGPAEVEGALTTLTGAASWRPTYDLRLDDGIVTIERRAVVEQFTGADWAGINLTLSTVTPSGQVAPSPTPPQIPQIGLPAPRPLARTMAEPMMAEQAIADTGPMTALGGMEGAAYVFTVPTEQFVPTDASAEITLSTERSAAEVTTLAVPRRDATAFVVAEVTNASGGPLLAGNARLYRDGTFMGETFLEEIPAGADAEVPFGPVEHLRLTHRVRDRQSGDRGLITRSNTREDIVELTVENLSDTGEDVRVLYALPISEQEDLVIDIDPSRPITERDVRDTRGLAAWDLSVPARGEETITLTLRLTWPEGEELFWRP